MWISPFLYIFADPSVKLAGDINLIWLCFKLHLSKANVLFMQRPPRPLLSFRNNRGRLISGGAQAQRGDKSLGGGQRVRASTGPHTRQWKKKKNHSAHGALKWCKYILYTCNLYKHFLDIHHSAAANRPAGVKNNASAEYYYKKKKKRSDLKRAVYLWSSKDNNMWQDAFK